MTLDEVKKIVADYDRLVKMALQISTYIRHDECARIEIDSDDNCAIRYPKYESDYYDYGGSVIIEQSYIDSTWLTLSDAEFVISLNRKKIAEAEAEKRETAERNAAATAQRELDERAALKALLQKYGAP